MRKVQSTAPTRQAAIQKALDELGCELHEVDIEIVDEGSKGFLGIGAREVEVIVRAEHLPDDGSYAEIDEDNIGNLTSGVDYGSKTRSDLEARDSGRNRGRKRNRGRNQNQNRGKGGNGDGNRGNRAPQEQGNHEGSRGSQGGRDGGNRGARGNRGRNEKRNEGRNEGQNENRSEKRDEQTSDRNRNRNRGENREQSGKRTEQNEQARSGREETAPRSKRRDRTTPIDPVAAEALGEESAVFLQEIITKMGMESTVTSKLDAEMDIVLEISAEDSAILIGRKGRNLQALQFIINRIMLKGDENDVVDRIVVDVEGYVQRHRESLEEMALSMAARAKESGRSYRIKPLDAQERRIVHLALEKDEEIRTFSLGGSALRRVVIVPNNEGRVEGPEGEGSDADGDTDVDVDVVESLESDTVESDAVESDTVSDSEETGAEETEAGEADVEEVVDADVETDDGQTEAGKGNSD
jgi:spoIIIJ-associated protein